MKKKLKFIIILGLFYNGNIYEQLDFYKYESPRIAIIANI